MDLIVHLITCFLSNILASSIRLIQCILESLQFKYFETFEDATQITVSTVPSSNLKYNEM